MEKNTIGSEYSEKVKPGRGTVGLPACGHTTGKLLTAFFVVTMTAAAGLSFYIVAVPHQCEPFTEFYILGPGGRADNYPGSFGPGEMKTVRVGIVNHENKYKTYDLLVALNDSKTLTTLYEKKIALSNDETWEQPIGLMPDRAGAEMRIEFLLYKEGNRSSPYRDLYLRVNVTG